MTATFKGYFCLSLAPMCQDFAKMSVILMVYFLQFRELKDWQVRHSSLGIDDN